MRQPALFLSHGAPSFLLEENATIRFWQGLPALLPQTPRAILCVSAHWDAAQFSISGTLGKVGIQHDYYGFPQQLYDLEWQPADGAATSAWLLAQLSTLKIEVLEVNRPLDHGLWVPLKTAWPEPSFPVYQLSLSLHKGLSALWEAGQRLQQLRNDGVLIIGSGGITHNLGALDWNAAEGVATPQAASFVAEVEQAISKSDRPALEQPWRFSNGKFCHPTIEHYAPLLFALGAAHDENMEVIHRNWMYGTYAMHAWATSNQ